MAKSKPTYYDKTPPLNRIVKINKPNTRVYYDLQEIGIPDLAGIIEEFLKEHNLGN